MNLKVLGTNLQFVGEVDDFESFFTVLVHGDRSMARVTIKAEKNNTDVLVKGNYIYAEDAPEYLFIITDVQKVFDEKGCTLNLVAYDVFWILEGRITSAGTTAISNTSKSVEYTVKDWLTKCVVNPTDTNRAVSGLELGANQDRGSTVNTVAYHTPLADNIKQLLAIDGLGLRGGYNSTTKKFVVDIYEGADRSVGNSDGNAPVIFDIKYDNVIGGEEKDSNANVKNHAYVFCNREGARVMVEQPEPSGEATGALRREFAIATTDSLTDADMGVLGLSGLVSEERSVTVNHTALVGSFVYGVDYFLGDFVTVAGVKLRLVEVARAWEGHREKIDLTFGQKVVTEQTQTQENTARLQDLEVQVLGVGFGAVLNPAGAIQMFGGASAPSGWLLCDGSAVSRTTYADLFTVIGTTYGAGDGSTTFNLPNMKGRVAVGKDASQTEFDTLGETGGAKTHTLAESEMPAHVHSKGMSAYTSYWAAGGAPQSGLIVNTANTGSAGGGGAHNNLQPYIVLNYIIKT